jgi:DNA processing protein
VDNYEIKNLSGRDIPKPLLQIPQKPKILYYRGNIPDTEEYIFISVVGSRKYTTYGKEALRKIITDLRGYKVVIVSGLAYGIDTLAHEVAIENDIITVAFLGGGLDNIYPKQNTYLANKILSSGGALVSEFPPDFRATPWSFPRRNRLMAGISKAILVIEAELPSGSLITAKLGTEYNKEVLAVPGSIFSNYSTGTNMLIGLGATPITSAEDLLLALGIPHQNKYAENLPNDINLLNKIATAKSFTGIEMKILENLKTPITIEELIKKTEAPTQTTTSLLSKLELLGYIKNINGLWYRNK